MLKIIKNGSLEWFWGLLGELLEAFGPQDGSKLKTGSILTLPWLPHRYVFGSLFVTFSSLGRSWDLKMAILREEPFWHHFLEQILIKYGSLWKVKNLDNMCEGLQKSSFQLCRIWNNFRYHFGGHFGA